jgi:hypothetical protein
MTAQSPVPDENASATFDPAAAEGWLLTWDLRGLINREARKFCTVR